MVKAEAKVVEDDMADVAPESSDHRVLKPITNATVKLSEKARTEKEKAEVGDVAKEASEVSPQPFFAKGTSWTLIHVTSGQAVEPPVAASLESHQAVYVDNCSAEVEPFQGRIRESHMGNVGCDG